MFFDIAQDKNLVTACYVLKPSCCKRHARHYEPVTFWFILVLLGKAHAFICWHTNKPLNRIPMKSELNKAFNGVPRNLIMIIFYEVWRGIHLIINVVCKPSYVPF